MTRDEALRLLGLSGNPSEEQIREAYRSRARIEHPDRRQDILGRQYAGFIMARINAARDLLLDRKPDADRPTDDEEIRPMSGAVQILVMVAGEANASRRLKLRTSGTAVLLTNFSSRDLDNVRITVTFWDDDSNELREVRIRSDRWYRSETLSASMNVPDDESEKIEEIDIEVECEMDDVEFSGEINLERDEIRENCEIDEDGDVSFDRLWTIDPSD